MTPQHIGALVFLLVMYIIFGIDWKKIINKYYKKHKE